MIQNKKAQLTIFIIIGIVLLFSAALVIYIQQSITEYRPPVEIALEQVPTELRPLQKYVTDCVNSVAKEALIKAGVQGGYIDTSGIIVNDQDPTSAEGISLSPGSNIKIPYWYYMKSSNTCDENCEFDSKQLPLFRGRGDSLEDQMDEYVEQKLSSCIRDFIPFRAQDFEIEQSTIKAFTTIARTDVFVQLDYPLTVTREGRVEKLSKFVGRIPVNLGKFYDLANELTEKEAKTAFLGFMAFNLIDVYSGIDENKLPPIADTTFGRGQFVSWLHRDVKSDIEELLMIHTPALQATGTLNFQGNYYQGDDQLAEGLYSLFILPLNKTHRANAEFTYLSWWPTYLKVTPSEGELIKPESASGFHFLLSALGVNQYRFAYDLSYPVLITLSDANAMDGEGFVFQFALESNVRNNAPMKADTRLLSYAGGRPSSTLACNPGNFHSGNITIDVTDPLTNEPLEGALVYFSFGRESCFIGESVIENGRAIVHSKMPVGIGTLVISKEDYISKTIPFGTKIGVEQELDVELDPFIDIDVSLARIPIVKQCQTTPPTGNVFTVRTKGLTICYWTSSQTSIPDLEFTQRATITMIRTPENDAQEDFVVGFEMRGDEELIKTIRLVPGNYQIIGNLFDYQRTIIPEDEQCFDDDWYDSFGLGKQKCEIIPSIEFNVFPKGGVSIDSFEITADDLKDSKEMVIYLFATPDGYTRDVNGVTNLEHEDLEQAGKAEQYSRDYIELIEPEFIK